MKEKTATLEQVLKKHEEICLKARTLIAKKGHDYNREQQDGGDTLFNMRVSTLLGITDTTTQGVLVRLSDKFQRLNSLTKNPKISPEVKDEAIADTVADIINYSIYDLIFYEEERWRLNLIPKTEIINPDEYMEIKE